MVASGEKLQARNAASLQTDQLEFSQDKTREGSEHKVFLQNMTRKISRIYHEYPRTFWNVAVISFIDHIGDAALIFPFFALYLTSKFGAGITRVGVLFCCFLAFRFWRFCHWRRDR